LRGYGIDERFYGIKIKENHNRSRDFVASASDYGKSVQVDFPENRDY
jgi:hypothetical protein